MARDPSKRWGDPRWTMRRTVIFAVFGYLGFLLLFAFYWPPETITAVSGLLGSMAFIITPILLAYISVPEIKEITGAAPGSKTTLTTSIEEVTAPPEPPKDKKKA